MSYNEVSTKKTILISAEQDRKVKYFCKVRLHMTFSQLVRLWIDELPSMQEFDTPKSHIESIGLRVNHFVGAYKGDTRPTVHGVNDDMGHKETHVLKKTVSNGLFKQWFGHSNVL